MIRKKDQTPADAPAKPAAPKTAAKKPVAKTPAEESFKKEIHPFDSWRQILDICREGTAKLPKEWGFRMRWYGLFWEGPRSDSFMVRIKVNGGRLRAGQLSGLADLAERYAEPYLDLTTRQGVQIRGVAARDIEPLFDDLKQLGLTSMQSGADNVRNLTACPLTGLLPGEYADVSPLVAQLADTFVGNRDFADLPRKFNVAVSGCGTNCTHPELHDIAVIALPPETTDGRERYTLRVGGQPSTSHFVSQDLNLLLTAEEVPAVCAAIVSVFRDNGFRGGRKKARMAHLIDDWGLERFRSEVATVLGHDLTAGSDTPPLRAIHKDPVGVHPQSQPGKVYVGVPVSVGRLTLEKARALATLITESGAAEMRITPRQNLILAHLPEAAADGVVAQLAAMGLPVSASAVRAAVTACSGSAYCKLGTVETKSRAEDITTHLEKERLADNPLTIALSACPNTCALHSVVDIGLQGCKTKQGGKTVEAFHLFLGGGTGVQTDFGRQIFRQVPGDQLNDHLAYAIKVYQRRATAGESFRAFCGRFQEADLAQLFQPQLSPASPVLRWMAERVLRLSGDHLTTYV